VNDLDRAAFAEGMIALCETFNEPISDIKVEAYFDALSEFSIGQVNGAIRLAMRQSTFMPRPASLREFIQGNASENADAAWGAVLREIRRVGYMGSPQLEPRALKAVNELWGSWRRLCETLPAEGPELVGWVKQFKGVYGSVELSEQRQLSMAALAPNVRQFIQAEQKRLR
jgi:hypothetical protein